MSLHFEGISRMFEHIQEYLAVSVSGLFAAICGGLSYFLKVEEGHEFKAGEFILHTLISGVSGLIAYLLFQSMSMPPNFCGAMAGISGWMGTSAMKVFTSVWTKRMGGDQQ